MLLLETLCLGGSRCVVRVAVDARACHEQLVVLLMAIDGMLLLVDNMDGRLASVTLAEGCMIALAKTGGPVMLQWACGLLLQQPW